MHFVHFKARVGGEGLQEIESLLDFLVVRVLGARDLECLAAQLRVNILALELVEVSSKVLQD